MSIFYSMKHWQTFFVFVAIQSAFAVPPTIEWIKEYPHGNKDNVSDMLALSGGGAIILGNRDVSYDKIEMFVSRIDIAGKEIWRKEYPWIGNVPEIKLCQDSLGNIFVAGISNRDAARWEVSWPFEMKISPNNGDTLWTERWRDTLNAYLIGSFPTNEETANLILGHNHGIRIVSKGGHPDWDWYYDVFGSGLARVENECWVTAKTSEIYPLIIPYPFNSPPPLYSIVETYKYTSYYGRLVGMSSYRCDYQCSINQILALSDNGLIMVGGSDSKHIGRGYLCPGAMYVARLDSSLDTLWTRQYPISDYDTMMVVATDVIIMPNHNYLVASLNQLWLARDFYLSEVDTSGNLIWNKYYGDGTFKATKIVRTPDGKLLIAGTKSTNINNRVGNPCLIRLKF